MSHLLDSANEFQQWFVKEWSEKLALALESMTGQPVSITPALGATFDLPGEDGVWWQHTFQSQVKAPIWIGAPGPTWKALAGQILEATGIGEVSEDETKGTYLELLQHSISGITSSLTALIGRELNGARSRILDAAPSCKPIPLTIGQEGLPIFLGISPELRESLQDKQPKQPAPSPAAAPAAPEPAKAQEVQMAPAPSNIEVLYDVELPVSISFGRAQLPLREVLKLTSGSIVELNRTVSEPVEVVVNNCVIARGDVVVVDGNYGVKISHIVSAGDRIRSLK